MMMIEQGHLVRVVNGDGDDGNDRAKPPCEDGDDDDRA